MVGVEVEELILKSTTLSICERDTCDAPPFAPTLPETEMVWLVAVMAGVTSTSTAAPMMQLPVHAASVGILQTIVVHCTAVQVPVPEVTFAWAGDASPVVGTVARKITLDALSGPTLMMSKVNAA